ncbi:TPM domain-containing protein [Sphingomonas gilva]|uniref:TPM domain-containing protein n=1 Tax=Sphingomonas gilva TaxID=2305907 RepID=A0A396RS36_9SPHN|nr:TPM domain-containing protein [Sphingomonas gilva]RHW19330.1 TPM domain-containing protein [Sphingomonas gilva]
MSRVFLLLLLALASLAPAHAQTFPQRTTEPVVDAANIIPPDQEAELSGLLDRFEEEKGQQFVVATVPSLEGRTIEDYGYRLGRAWGIGRQGVDDGVILLVAPNEKKVRIEVGYGLTPVLTAQLSGLIVREQILPRFRDGDMPGGIRAGADAILEQLRLPAPQAEARAKRILAEREAEESDVNWFAIIFWLVVIAFIVVPMIAAAARGAKGGKRYRRGRGPVVIWGPGWGGGHSGSGWGGSSWGGGGGGSWSGGGGFSGGGGSFGGGGASGGW